MTLQNVEKPTPWGCLVVASRFDQPEIQSTLKFVYERKRASKKEGELGGGDMDGGKRAETFPRATIDVPRREGWKVARVRLRKCADHFSGTSLSCPTTIMRMWHNGDRDRRGYCARRSSHFCTSLRIFSIFYSLYI